MSPTSRDYSFHDLVKSINRRVNLFAMKMTYIPFLVNSVPSNTMITAKPYTSTCCSQPLDSNILKGRDPQQYFVAV